MNKNRHIIIKLCCISLVCWMSLRSERSGWASAQNIGINGTGAAPDASAILDVSAAPTNNKGLLLPRLNTTERNLIVAPAQSLLIYNITDSCFQGYIGTQWISFGCVGSSIPPPPFSCGSPFTDTRDGKTYNTVLIGSQCWMAENLNYGTYVPVLNGGQAPAGTQKYCQNLSGVNDPTCPFGGLYEWAEMMNGSTSCNGTGTPPNDDCATPVQGICPTGWHIPSHYEWTTLEKNVGINSGAFLYDVTTMGWLGTDEGGNLKQTGTTNWTTPNTGATNTSSFTAFPGGYSFSGVFNFVGLFGYWWSSTENSGTFALHRELFYINAQVNRSIYNKAFGFSCRCVKD